MCVQYGTHIYYWVQTAMYLPRGGFAKIFWAICTWLRYRREGTRSAKNTSAQIQNLAANSTVYSQQLMKAGTTHALRRISHFRWLGQTILRISSSHGVYANFKVKFIKCESSQFSCVYFVFYFYVFTVSIIMLSMSVQPYGCKGNTILSYLTDDATRTVAKAIQSCLILLTMPQERLQRQYNPVLSYWQCHKNGCDDNPNLTHNKDNDGIDDWSRAFLSHITLNASTNEYQHCLCGTHCAAPNPCNRITGTIKIMLG